MTDMTETIRWKKLADEQPEHYTPVLTDGTRDGMGKAFLKEDEYLDACNRPCRGLLWVWCDEPSENYRERPAGETDIWAHLPTGPRTDQGGV